MKKIRSTRTINFRDTHNGRGFAVRGIDRQLAFSLKRRAQGPRDAMKSVHECIFRRHATSRRSSAPEGAKLSLKSLSKRLDSPQRGSRGFIYDLPATARPARIQGVAGFGDRGGANVISQAKSLRSLTSIAAESISWWAIPCETLQIPARLNKFPVQRNKIPCSDF